MNVPRGIDLAGFLDRPIGGERLLHEGLHALLAGGLVLDSFEHEAMGRTTGLPRHPGDAVDVLHDGRRVREFRAPRIAGRQLHGTGCVLSAAIAAGLALGNDLEEAVAEAKRYVTLAIETAPAGAY